MIGHNYYVNTWDESFTYSFAHLKNIKHLNQQKGGADQEGFHFDKRLGRDFVSQTQSKQGLDLNGGNFTYFSSSLPLINKSKFCLVLARHVNVLQPCQPDTCISFPNQGRAPAFLPSSADCILSAFQKLWRLQVSPDPSPDLFWVAVALRNYNSFSSFVFSFLCNSEQNCVL